MAEEIERKHLEDLGELYYQNQKKERNMATHEEFIKIGAHFPCVRGVTPIGLSDELSVKDGHKFGCGIHAISAGPIVYSFGSNQQQDFELAFLKLRPDAKIFTFELKADNLPPLDIRSKHVNFFNMGMG